MIGSLNRPWVFYRDGAPLPEIEAEAPYPTKHPGEWRFGYRPDTVAEATGSARAIQVVDLMADTSVHFDEDVRIRVKTPTGTIEITSRGDFVEVTALYGTIEIRPSVSNTVRIRPAEPDA